MSDEENDKGTVLIHGYQSLDDLWIVLVDIGGILRQRNEQHPQLWWDQLDQSHELFQQLLVVNSNVVHKKHLGRVKDLANWQSSNLCL